MRLFYSDKLPTSPDLLTPQEWRGISIDPQQRLSIGIVEDFHLGQNIFELHVWALENDRPKNPNSKRKRPEYQANPSGNPDFYVKYRGMLYVPGTAPKQRRRPVELHLASMFITITKPNLNNLLSRIDSTLDTTGFSKNDIYLHIIKDGGIGPKVRELLIDGRDLGY